MMEKVAVAVACAGKISAAAAAVWGPVVHVAQCQSFTPGSAVVILAWNSFLPHPGVGCHCLVRLAF